MVNLKGDLVMTETPKEIPAPLVLKELIISCNDLLVQHQSQLTQKVTAASIECMQMLGLDPRDGWRLDMQNMVFTKKVPENQQIQQ